MWVHRVSGAIIFFLTFVFVLKMIAYFDWSIDTSAAHFVIGTLILCLVGVVMLYGVAVRQRLNKA
jgi:uncharacterized membrane protein